MTDTEFSTDGNGHPIYKGPLHMCVYCQMMFISEEFLTRHQEKCIHVALLSLVKSKLELKGNQSIKGHSTNIVENNQTSGEYFCDKCFSWFLESTEYEKHFREHHPNEILIQKCKLNKYSIYNGDKSFECIHCSKKFLTRTKLTAHSRTHTGEKPFCCTHCPMKFCLNYELMVHLRTHTGEKPFACTHCPKKFSRNGNLNVHLRTHTGEKPFVCEHCSMKFSERSTYIRHMRTHTGEKPFDCTHCSMKFSRKATLTEHLRTHTKEKPFGCTHCPKKFSDRSNYTRHLRTCKFQININHKHKH